MANKISDNIEEYLEVLYGNGSNGEQVSTTKLSTELGFAPGSVTQMLKKLETLGYIEYTPYKGAILTAEGLEIAQKITRKHRLLEIFLLDILKIKMENVHEQACEMEHALSDEAERALCMMLKNPDLCPDKNVIPSCNFDFDNCNQCYSQKDFDMASTRDFSVLALSELNLDTEGVISFIRGNDELLGIIDNLNIKIGGNLVFKVDDNNDENLFLVTIDDVEFKIPLKLANNIFIRI